MTAPTERRFTLSVPRRLVRCARLCAATDDPRPHLNAVTIDVTALGGSIAAANCHALFAAEFEVAASVPRGRIIIPRDLLPISRNGADTDVVIEVENARVTVWDLLHVRGRTGLLIEADGINWRAVVPQKTSGETAWYDYRYLHLLERVAARMSHRYPVLSYNGHGAALCVLDGGAAVFDHVLRRVRLAARACGCNRAQVEIVEARAAGQLDAHARTDDVLTSARALAQRLAAGEHVSEDIGNG